MVVLLSSPKRGRGASRFSKTRSRNNIVSDQQNGVEKHVNNTFEVSQVYFHKDSNLLALLEDRLIPHTFSYKLIAHFALANTTYSTSVVQRTLELIRITNYKLG